jgi:hypothetical protein
MEEGNNSCFQANFQAANRQDYRCNAHIPEKVEAHATFLGSARGGSRFIVAGSCGTTEGAP